jgi:hypothetical protein
MISPAVVTMTINKRAHPFDGAYIRERRNGGRLCERFVTEVVHVKNLPGVA